MLRMHTWMKTDQGGRQMDSERARSLLIAERDEVQGLLKDAEAAGPGRPGRGGRQRGGRYG